MKKKLAALLLMPCAVCAFGQMRSAPVEVRPVLGVPAAPAPLSPILAAPAPALSAAAAPVLSAAAVLPAASVLAPGPLAAASVEPAPAAPAPPSLAAAPSIPSSRTGSRDAASTGAAAPLDALFDGAGGARRIRLDVRADDSPDAVASARVFLSALAAQPKLGSARESSSVRRLRPLFHLRTRHVASLDPAAPQSLLLRPEGRLPRFGAFRYVDLTNGSRFSTVDAKGRVRHFVAVRALREGYAVRVDMRSGSVATEGYVSDQLLFEVKYDAKGNVRSRQFVGPLVLSTSDDILVESGKFVFEDGRVYSPAPGRLVVSGTVIADFLGKPRTLSYRNGMADLVVDPVSGIPSVKRDPATGDPAWHYLTPVGADFKNGMVLSTGRGKEVVALFRLNAPEALGPRIPAGYSLIRFSFASYEDFLKYDSSHLLEDARHPEALSSLTRPHPEGSGVLLAAADLRDPYAGDPRVTKTGFGPGAKPARVSMRSNGDVYLQESLGARSVRIGRVPANERAGFPLRPGEKKWLFLGHELRYYRDGAQMRDYNAFAWLTDESMGRVERVRASLMTPDSSFESGESSLIVDLARHNYPMGAEVMENGEYHFSYGASDKHTGAAKLDVMGLLRELSDGSAETREGLAYRPRG